jgi:hypothetical protein
VRSAQNSGYGIHFDGSLRRRKDAGQEFPHRHRCVSSALIHRAGVAGSIERVLGRPQAGMPGCWNAPDAHYPFAFGTMTPLTRPEPEKAAPDGDRTAQEHPVVSEAPVSTLRGAGAQVDGHTVAKVVLGLVVATLAVLVVVFVIVGTDKINELRGQGVPVTFTVTSCQGLLGGSGSNGAGYACRGTYHLGGHTYNQSLPGTAFFAPGATVHAIAVPSDPGLVSPVTIVESEHASWKVYILPVILFVGLVLIVGAIMLRRRARRRSTQAVQARGV